MTGATVLCIGYVNWDLVVKSVEMPEPDNSSEISAEKEGIGGSAANTALALSSLGIDTTLAGNLGNDTNGRKARDALKERDVTLTVTNEAVPTTRILALATSESDPRYLAKNQDYGPLSPDDISDETWSDVDHVHLTSFAEEAANALAIRATEEDCTVSFNPSQQYKHRQFPDVVDAADLIFMNEREASIFRDRYNFGQVASETAVTVTHGAAGSTTYSPSGVYHHAGYSTTDVEDTIGAGDASVAGFLSAWLGETDIETAIAQANACGAYAVERTGSVDRIDADALRSIQSQETI